MRIRQRGNGVNGGILMGSRSWQYPNLKKEIDMKIEIGAKKLGNEVKYG